MLFGAQEMYTASSKTCIQSTLLGYTIALAVYILRQWNPLITDTIGNQNFIPRCPYLRSFQHIFDRCGMRNWAVEQNMAVFSEFSFAVRWQGRLVLRITALI